MSKALIVLSGGQDSTTAAFWAKNNGFDELHAVTFDYGQRHAVEVDAARKVAKLLRCKSHEIIELGADVLAGTSPLVSDAELEQYEDHASLPGGLEKTFVPMRNQLFLTIAANRAYVLGINNLITGVCQEDSGGYPDCRQSFVTSLAQASSEGTFTGKEGAPPALNIHTPLMDLTKAESVLLALKLKNCYAALAQTHTSYDGQYPPVGKDHATLLRAKGFEEAGVPDPLVLRAVKEGVMKKPKSKNYSASALKSVAPRLQGWADD